MERVNRKDDERLYNPRIHSQRIRELHKISEQTGQPMTVIIDTVLRRFIEESTNPLPRYSPLENPVFEPNDHSSLGMGLDFVPREESNESGKV